MYRDSIYIQRSCRYTPKFQSTCWSGSKCGLFFNVNPVSLSYLAITCSSFICRAAWDARWHSYLSETSHEVHCGDIIKIHFSYDCVSVISESDSPIPVVVDSYPLVYSEVYRKVCIQTIPLTYEYFVGNPSLFEMYACVAGVKSRQTLLFLINLGVLEFTLTSPHGVPVCLGLTTAKLKVCHSYQLYNLESLCNKV